MQAIAAMQFVDTRRTLAITSRPNAALRDVSAAVHACSTCHVQELCMPSASMRTARMFDAASAAIAVRKGETLFRAGDHFTALYRDPLRLLQDGAAGRRWPRAGLRLSHARRHHRHRRHRRRQPRLRRDRARGYRGLRAAVRSHRGARPRQHGFQRNLHRLLSQEIARERQVMLMLGTMRAEQRLASVPARPVAALSGARLFVDRVRAADDARGDRQLPRAQARDRQPPVLALPRGRADPGHGRVVKLLDRVVLRTVVETNSCGAPANRLQSSRSGSLRLRTRAGTTPPLPIPRRRLARAGWLDAAENAIICIRQFESQRGCSEHEIPAHGVGRRVVGGRVPRFRAGARRDERRGAREARAEPRRQPHQPAVPEQHQPELRPREGHAEHPQHPAGDPDLGQRGLEHHHAHDRAGDLDPALGPGTDSKNGIGDTVFTAFLSPANPATGSGARAGRADPTNSSAELGNKNWGLGPSFVVLHLEHGSPWVYGVLVNNIWSLTSNKHGGSYNNGLIQPFVNYNFEAACTSRPRRS